jgi:hypothetical protein
MPVLVPTLAASSVPELASTGEMPRLLWISDWVDAKIMMRFIMKVNLSIHSHQKPFMLFIYF